MKELNVPERTINIKENYSFILEMINLMEFIKMVFHNQIFQFYVKQNLQIFNIMVKL